MYKRLSTSMSTKMTDGEGDYPFISYQYVGHDVDVEEATFDLSVLSLSLPMSHKPEISSSS
jgi:hypothetical protein